MGKDSKSLGGRSEGTIKRVRNEVSLAEGRYSMF